MKERDTMKEPTFISEEIETVEQQDFIGSFCYKIVVPLFLIISSLYGMILFYDEELATTCSKSPYLRAQNPDVTKTVFFFYSLTIRNFLSFGVIRAILLITATRIIQTTNFKKHMLICILVIFITYFFPGLYLVNYLTEYLEDVECHTRHNSVSGHSYYSLWAILLVWYLSHLLERTTTSSQSKRNMLDTVLLSINTPVAVFCLGLQLFFTFYYGYHSLQQMFFGATIGILYAALTIFCAEVSLHTVISTITQKQK